MKILAFVDIHSSLSALKKIRKKAIREKPDCIICAGDITIFEQGLKYILNILNKLSIPIFIVNGNHESIKNMHIACSNLKNVHFVHDKIFMIQDIAVFGYGGGGFTRNDDGFENSVKKYEKSLKGKKLILISHQPPYGTKVDKIVGRYCGNKSVTSFIKKFKPILVICGHLHENARKKDKIKDTKVINPGPFGEIINI